MREGANVIYQAVLFDGRPLGYTDILVRVEQASDLGPWSYEVWDTKLARYAKASAILQICMYSDMVSGLQGRSPEKMHLALGDVRAEKVAVPGDCRQTTHPAGGGAWSRNITPPPVAPRSETA